MSGKKIKRTYRKTRYVLYRETLVDTREHFWAFVGSSVGIGIIAYLQSTRLPVSDVVYLIGSFGASAVLVYGVIHSPLAQPRNLIGGHLISAIIGVTAQKFLPDVIWLQAPLAVAFSIVAMQVTKTLHPPGGATALIAVTGSEKIKALGYAYVVSPVFTGALILFCCAFIFNNISTHRSYPSARSQYGIRKKMRTVLRRK